MYYAKSNKSKKETPEGEKFYVEKGTFNYKDASYQVLKKINNKLLKRNPYSFEKETRFYFEIDNEKFDEIIKDNNYENKKYKLANLNYIKVILDIKEEELNNVVKVTKLPKFLKHNDNRNYIDDSNRIDNCEVIPNWNIKVNNSELEQPEYFIDNNDK